MPTDRHDDNTDAAEPAHTPAAGGLSRWQGRLSITVTLAAAIGLFVLVTAGSVLAIGVWLAGLKILKEQGKC